ncbi:MAG: lipocalin-like domain-containing protein, partial [Woeseiaceae bacterium]|nr:lipocalin-like domain-containing protein [Woeseiaceae bacterium]
RFGFELTIFRFALQFWDSDLNSRADGGASAWRTNQVYIAHFAVTDADRERFYVAQKYSRGALGLAGAQAEPFRVWIDDWYISADDSGDWRLQAEAPEFAINVTLAARKPAVLNGVDGLSQKSAEPGNASYYYSVTRWQTDGELRIGDDFFPVSGLSWLDREWSSSALGDDQQGWDWFALQLDDDTELMFYNIRKHDGSQDPNSAGTFVAADGSASYVNRKAVGIEVTDTWDSPDGGRYPSGWLLELPSRGLQLRVTPVMRNQELSTTVRYWEGAVDVSGTKHGTPVRGRGYVELTGYAEGDAGE